MWFLIAIEQIMRQKPRQQEHDHAATARGGTKSSRVDGKHQKNSTLID